MRYRNQFVYDVAFGDYDFNHKVVADLVQDSVSIASSSFRHRTL